MNISQIVGIHRNLVAPSQSVRYGTATSVGDQTPRIVFRAQKIGSHLAGKLSEIRFTIGVQKDEPEQVFTGAVVAQSMLNSVKQINVYIGQTKILGYNDCFLHLNNVERMSNHPTQFHNTCAYYFGFNEKFRTHIIPNDDGQDFTDGFRNYKDDNNPFYRLLDIQSLSADGFSQNNTFDFVLPLPVIAKTILDI